MIIVEMHMRLMIVTGRKRQSFLIRMQWSEVIMIPDDPNQIDFCMTKQNDKWA